MAFEPIPLSSASGNISGAEYDPDTQTLVVQYARKGKMYRYFPVTGEQVSDLSQAPSATSYLRQFIMGTATEELLEDGTGRDQWAVGTAPESAESGESGEPAKLSPPLSSVVLGR